MSSNKPPITKNNIISDDFDFLSAWKSEDESIIINRFPKDMRKNCSLIKCHFKSDLLVISNVVPNSFDEFDVCKVLSIPYDSCFGANTMCCEDIILNVNKVRRFFQNQFA